MIINRDNQDIQQLYKKYGKYFTLDHIIGLASESNNIYELETYIIKYKTYYDKISKN